MEYQAFIRKHCPNIPILRKCLSTTKLKQLRKYCCPNSEVVRAERDDSEKLNFIVRCSAKWPELTADIKVGSISFYNRAEKELSDSELEEILFCFFAYGFSPEEYLSLNLSGKTPKERRLFVSNRDRDIVVYSLNDIIEMDRFFDKWKTYLAFSEYYGREAQGLSKESDYELFSSFVERHPVCVQKRTRLSKGDSVALLDSASIQDKKAYFSDLISHGEVILEELIQQSDEMARLNMSSVNTVRFITIMTNDGPRIVNTFLKVGRGGSFVDNGGAGGLLVGIDSKTGTLDTDARDEFSNVYVEHPDSHILFCGYQLPDWQKAIDLVMEASAREKVISYIGWDLAHTDHGWAIVEGNASSQLIGPQIVYQRGIRESIQKVALEAKRVVDVRL